MPNEKVYDLRLKMVKKLVENGYIMSKHVEHAFLTIEREKFVNLAPEHAYKDVPLPIGYGQTSSAPHMVAIYLEQLELQSGLKILEIGTGSGYHLAVTACALDYLSGGEIHSIEINPFLLERANRILSSYNFKTKISIHLGDGFYGLKEEAPFDRIYVTAALVEKPKMLYEQLKIGGILLYPYGIQGEPQLLIKAKRTQEGIKENEVIECSFVQLRRAGEEFRPS